MLFWVSVVVTTAKARLDRELVESFSESDDPVSIPYNTSLVPGSEDLPIDDPRIAPKTKTDAPEQVSKITSRTSEKVA
jgi:hypothetical protein